MRLISVRGISGIFLMLTLFLTTDGALYADAGPEDSLGGEAAQASNPEPLRQFPQAETAPAAETQAAVSEPAAKTPGSEFPKVKTRDDMRMARKFSWWPSDAKPAPVKDPGRSGYWWWPQEPGTTRPWGNQGFVYVRKVIFDYKSAEGEMKPSLVIKKIIKNVKVYFDFDKSDLRDDARAALEQAMDTLGRNPQADILVTGNADVRGSEQYNLKLGERRADAVRDFLLEGGLPEERIRILSRGKLDAMAPANDLIGMQRDRNAQFMIAEVEEVMLPASQASLYQDRVIEERREIAGQIKVDVKEYVIRKGDTLWKIAQTEYGDGNQWKRIYEFNKEVIADPNRPKQGTRIKIPIE